VSVNEVLTSYKDLLMNDDLRVTPTMAPTWQTELEMATPSNQMKSTLEDCCKLLKAGIYKQLSV